MNLLLTSSGLTNKTIISALADLVQKPFAESKLAFIPTAANLKKSTKDWLITDMTNCLNCNFAGIDIVDFSAIPQENWQPRLESSDIIVFGGGSSVYLWDMLVKHGLKDFLPELFETRVYVGISAGSMIAAPRISLSRENLKYFESTGNVKTDEGLGFVNFQMRPHLNSPHFPNVREDYLQKIAPKIPDTFYAIDDNTAIQVKNDQIEIVTEGEWIKFN